MPAAAAYLFLLGFAAGLVLLALSAYRHVSPGWLRVLLVASGILLLARYAALFLFPCRRHRSGCGPGGAPGTRRPSG